MTPNAYGHSWPQQDDHPSSSHLDRTETLAEIHAYDYRNTPQYEYSDYAEPRTAFDPFAGAVWVPDPPPPPPPLAPTTAPAPVSYYGPELYYQRLNFGPPPPPPPPEEEEENAALAYRTSTTPLTPTTAYQTATAAAEIPYHQQQCYPAPPQYSYEHFQRYPLAASEYPLGASDHPQQQYTHVDKRPRVDEEDAGAPGTFTSLSGNRASGDDRSASSSYFHLPISGSDPPPRHSIPIPTPISITDLGGGAVDSRERAGPLPLSHSSSANVRWFRQDPLLPPPPSQPGPAAHFSSSHVERVYNGDISGEGERGGGGAGGATARAQQQQQQRPSLATLSSGSSSTLGSATTTVSSSSFSALSSTSLPSIAPNQPQSGSPLAPPAPAVAASTRPQQQEQNGPLSYTPQQQRQMSVTVDHRPGGTGEAIIESEHLRAKSQSQQSREGGGGGILSPPSSSQPVAVAHGQLPPPPNQNQPKKTQVSKSEKSCKACRSVRVLAYLRSTQENIDHGSTARCAGSAKSVALGRGRVVLAAPRNASTATTAI